MREDAITLNVAANKYLKMNQGADAIPLLQQAIALDPDQPALYFNLAAAHSQAGEYETALIQIGNAIARDPYFVQALYQKAVLLERLGRKRDAARAYADVLDTAPEEVLSDARFAHVLNHARNAIAADRADLAEQLDMVPPSLRAREARDALLGQGRIYVSEPTFFAVPRLPAIPFFDRALTPWLELLEAQTENILTELLALLGQDAGSRLFSPYVANPPGTPLNQWADLDHSTNWSALSLWKHGIRQDHCDTFPKTAALLDQMPMPQLAGRAPNALFSRLKPATRIPPHAGVTNLRATVHLPLIVPPGCSFRVGAEVRQWRVGEAWVFDDSIEHEAWNESAEDRLILIFDVWHPLVEEEERTYFAELLKRHDRHYGYVRGLSDTL